MSEQEKKPKTKIAALAGVLPILFLAPTMAHAYVPLAPLPEVTATGVTLSAYLSAMFKIGLGLAGVFAVLMIVLGGIQFIGGASNPSARTDAKSKITNAIFGLILAAGSWLILNTINPDLLKMNLTAPKVGVSIGIPSSEETKYAPPGGSCGNGGGSCVEGRAWCPGSTVRDFGGKSCDSGYICCRTPGAGVGDEEEDDEEEYDI